MKLSLLDYGLLDEGKEVDQAWQDSLALVQRAESRGYSRFWLAEHHNVGALTITSPEVLMTYLASQTQRIRIGSGGIMGLHYTPYKIAELATSLALLFPDRIDIGLGSSTGTALVSKHLKNHYQTSQFGQWLTALTAYLTGQEEISHLPPLPQPLPLFTLGMGGQSVTLAAQQGLGYVFGSFPFIDHEPLELATSLARAYRQDFRPSVHQSTPYFILALFVVIADNQEQAERLAASLDLWMLGKQDFNDLPQFPSYDTYQSYPFTEAERERMAIQSRRIIVGDKERVKEQVDAFLEVCQPDELMVIPLVAGLANRLRAVDLMADLYGKTESDENKNDKNS